MRKLLAPTYELIDLITYLLAATTTISAFVFLNSSQTFVLVESLHVPLDELGNLSGSLVFYDELIIISSSWLWGSTSDFIGRFPSLASGFLFQSLGLFLFCKAKSYEELVLYRIIFALGGASSSSMISAILGDIITNERYRGKLASLVGICAGVGAILGVSLISLPPRIGLENTFNLLVLIEAFVISLLLVAYGLRRRRKGNVRELDHVVRETEDDEEEGGDEEMEGDGLDARLETEGREIDVLPGRDEEDPLLLEGALPEEVIDPSPSQTDVEVKRDPHFLSSIYSSFSVSIQLAKNNRNVLLGLLSSFLARSDSISITLFIPIWIYHYFLQEGKCSSSISTSFSFSDEKPTKNTCKEAYIQASIMSGVTQTFALIGAPFIGFFLDRFDRFNVIIISSGSACLGYILLGLQDVPTSPLNYILLFLIGVGEIGLVISSLTLISHSSIPRNGRGAVIGASSMFGGLGILISSKVGGLLFDIEGGVGFPFLFLGFVHIIFLCITCILAFKR